MRVCKHCLFFSVAVSLAAGAVIIQVIKLLRKTNMLFQTVREASHDWHFKQNTYSRSIAGVGWEKKSSLLYRHVDTVSQQCPHATLFSAQHALNSGRRTACWGRIIHVLSSECITVNKLIILNHQCVPVLCVPPMWQMSGPGCLSLDVWTWMSGLGLDMLTDVLCGIANRCLDLLRCIHAWTLLMLVESKRPWGQAIIQGQL